MSRFQSVGKLITKSAISGLKPPADAFILIGLISGAVGFAGYTGSKCLFNDKSVKLDRRERSNFTHLMDIENKKNF